MVEWNQDILFLLMEDDCVWLILTVKMPPILQQLPSTATLAHNLTWEMCQCEKQNEANKSDRYFHHQSR